jgi:DNA-binding response OmpR family regulator
MSGAVCPCCGAKTDRPMVVDLATNRASVGTKVASLTPQCAEILYVLAESYPGTVSNETIIRRVWGHMDEPQYVNKCVQTQICHLRSRIKPLGLRIRNHFAAGYSLVLDEKLPVVRRGQAAVLNGAPL